MRGLVISSAALLALGLWGTACGGSTIVDPGSGGGSSTASSGANSTTTTGSTTGTTTSGGTFDQCTGPGECVLVSQTCCGVCGSPSVDDMTAVHVDQAAAHRDDVCGDPPPPCPDCAVAPNPNLFASCDAGTCVANDLGDHPFSECSSNADCTLRAGMGCCQSCSPQPFEIVAVAVGVNVAGTVCGPLEDCLACEPVFPDGVSAVCNAGHCEVDGVTGL